MDVGRCPACAKIHRVRIWIGGFREKTPALTRQRMKPKGKLKRPFDPMVFLTKANRGRTSAEYRIDDGIFVQGDTANAVFYITKGKVKLTVLSKQGKEAVVAILGDGDFFGEGCLAGQSVRMGTAGARSV